MAKAKQGVEAAPQESVSEESKKAVAVVRPLGIPANAVPVADCSEGQVMEYGKNGKLAGFNPVSKIAWIIPSLMIAFSMLFSPVQARADMGDEATLGGMNDNGSYRFRVNSSGNLIPGKDSSTNIGASGSEISNAYIDTVNATTVATTTATVTTGANPAPNSTVVVTTGVSNQYTRIHPQYFQLYVYTASTKPASGAKSGTVVMVSNANANSDCGTTGGGSTFAVCVSDGTNWKPLSNA